MQRHETNRGPATNQCKLAIAGVVLAYGRWYCMIHVLLNCSPVGRHCNWTAQVVTSIPDSHSRACAAPLPDGRIFMIGAQVSPSECTFGTIRWITIIYLS